VNRTHTGALRYSLSIVAATMAIAVGAPSGVALAQEPAAIDLAQARELLNLGLKLRAQGDLAGAVEKLRAAHAIVNTPITGLELARTYVMVSKLVEAREVCLAVAREPKRAEETARSAAARTEADRLGADLRLRIPSLHVIVTGVPKESVSVTVDDALVPTAVLDVPRLVNPGTHAVAARSTAGGLAQTTVDLKEGESRDVELQIRFAGGSAPPAPHQAIAEEAPAEAAPARPGQTQRIAALVTGGVGVVGLGVGVICGLVAKSKDDSAAQEPFPARHDDSLAAAHLSDAGTVVFVVGAAAVATGVVLWFTAPSDAVTVGLTGDRLLLQGRF
jgi:hypothetical protein